MNKNLLDTHTFIWYLNGDTDLSDKARQLIEANHTQNLSSIASLWEIAIKVSLGKLVLNVPHEKLLYLIDSNGFEILPIGFEDTLIIASLPFHHRDLFDRIIIAQSLTNQTKIISRNPAFHLYQTNVVW